MGEGVIVKCLTGLLHVKNYYRQTSGKERRGVFSFRFDTLEKKLICTVLGKVR
jgi:hypothetical protein